MTRNDTRIGWLCLILSVCVSAVVFAQVSHESGAYLSDAQTGLISGTYGSVPPVRPFRLEPGTSKALHWGQGDGGSASGEPIAQLDASGGMYLDFGEVLKGHGDARPDVFRMVSLVNDDREVSFRVTGAMSECVTVVRLGDGAGEELPACETARVYVKIRVPDDAESGTYTGTLSLTVEGWTAAVSIPISIDVVERASKHSQWGEVVIGDTGSEDTTIPSIETTVTVEGSRSIPDVLGGSETELDGMTDTMLPNRDMTSTLDPTSTAEPTATLRPGPDQASAEPRTLEQW